MSAIPLIGPDGQMPRSNILDLFSRTRELSKENVVSPKCKRLHDFKVISMLSHSHDSYVVKAEDKASGQEYVLKKLKYPRNSQFGLPLNAVREVGILRHLSHINIVASIGFVVESSALKNYIIFEHCREDVTQLLKNNSKLNESATKCILKMLLEGLSYLYNNLIIHRDICPDNLFIHPSGILKIGDFGKARLCEKTTLDEMDSEIFSTEVGTPGYRAPELILNCKKYTRAIDMWSFGCVFGELLNHKPIFNINKHHYLQLNSIIKLCGSPDSSYYNNCNRNPLLSNLSLIAQEHDTFNETFPDTCLEGIQLLQKCLQYDWDVRIKPEDCLNDKYFDIEPIALLPQFLLGHIYGKSVHGGIVDYDEIQFNFRGLMHGHATLPSGANDGNAESSSIYRRTDSDSHHYHGESLDSLSEGGIADSP